MRFFFKLAVGTDAALFVFVAGLVECVVRPFLLFVMVVRCSPLSAVAVCLSFKGAAPFLFYCVRFLGCGPPYCLVCIGCYPLHCSVGYDWGCNLLFAIWSAMTATFNLCYVICKSYTLLC